MPLISDNEGERVVPRAQGGREDTDGNKRVRKMGDSGRAERS